MITTIQFHALAQTLETVKTAVGPNVLKDGRVRKSLKAVAAFVDELKAVSPEGVDKLKAEKAELAARQLAHREALDAAHEKLHLAEVALENQLYDVGVCKIRNQNSLDETSLLLDVLPDTVAAKADVAKEFTHRREIDLALEAETARLKTVGVTAERAEIKNVEKAIEADWQRSDEIEKELKSLRERKTSVFSQLEAMHAEIGRVIGIMSNLQKKYDWRKTAGAAADLKAEQTVTETAAIPGLEDIQFEDASLDAPSDDTSPTEPPAAEVHADPMVVVYWANEQGLVIKTAADFADAREIYESMHATANV